MLKCCFARTISLLLALSGLAAEARAQVFEAVGVRASGMGGAFVAVSDDATAAYWNPGGFATGALFSVVLDRQTTEGRHPVQVRGFDASGAFVGLGMWPVGLSYYRVRVTEIDPNVCTADVCTLELRVPIGRSLITHHTGITVLRTLIPGVTVGTAVKLVRGVAAEGAVLDVDTDAAFDEASALIGRAENEFDLDVGVLAAFGRGRVAFVVRNLREPEFELPGGGHLGLQRQVRVGAAFRDATFTASVDADLTTSTTASGERRAFAAGIEKLLSRGRYAVRAGFRAHTIDDARPAATAGGSVAVWRSLYAEGQITRGGDQADRGWGVGLRLAF